MSDWLTPTERKRYKQLDRARDICSSAYDDVGHKSISAITRKLIKLRDYLNKEFPVKTKGATDEDRRQLESGVAYHRDDDRQATRADSTCDKDPW